MRQLSAASALLAIAITALAARPAMAAITNCEPDDPNAYTVFVDDVRPFDTSAPSGAEKAVKNALGLALSNSLETLPASDSGTLLRKVCQGRYPIMSDFDKRVVRPLDDRRVVLELWATVQQAPGQIQVNFDVVVIPAQLRYLALHQRPRGLLEIRRDVSPEVAHRLSPVLERNDEIKGYALIGAGLKAHDLLQYEEANSYLCEGEATLIEAFRANPNPAAGNLLNYVHEVGNKNYLDAQSPSAGNNRLKLLGPDKKSLRCRLK